MTRLLAVPFVAAMASAQAAPAADLGFMTGCWAFERGGKRHEEVWLTPTADGTLGMARTVRDGRTTSHEFTRLKVDADGAVTFIAHPSGQARAEFPLASLTGTRAVFENPAHDFPTRVIYAAAPPDRLDARIEGTLDGKPAAIDYPYRRVRCPTPER